MLVMYVYGAALSFVVVLSLWSVERRPNNQLARCAMAVAVNWLLGMAYSEFVATDGFLFNLAIDSITAAIVLWRPAARWQAVLGVAYVFQITCHLGYGARVLSVGTADAALYYDWITAVAFVQLVVLGGWGIGNGRLARRRGSSGPRVAKTRRDRVAGA